MFILKIILYPAHAVRGLGLLLADMALTVGWGKTFWRVSRFFFTKNTVTRKQKVEKLTPRCDMECNSKGYKRAIVKIWGHIAKKTDKRAEHRVFGPKKPHSFSLTIYLARHLFTLSLKEDFLLKMFSFAGIF